MFVASSLYNYATSRGDPANKESQPTKDNKVKIRPRTRQRPLSPPPSYASVAAESGESPGLATSFQEADQVSEETKAKLRVLDSIIAEEDLYKVLDVSRKAKPEEIRRAFLNRSRICHPDKFPSYPASTLAFQKVAFAYETLSKPTSRRIYDVSGRTDFAAAVNTAGDNGFSGSASGFGEETLNNVLYSVMCEFLEGDFDMIRVLVQALNDGSSGIQVGNDTVESLEGAFRKLREVLLAGRRYVRVVHLELIRLYEIQQHLRSLSYFDVFGRLRLTLQLARVTLSIPMAIDQAMKDPTKTGDSNVHGEEATRPPSDSGSDASSSEEDADEEEFFGIVSESRSSDEAERVASAHENESTRPSRNRKKAKRRTRRQNLEGASRVSDPTNSTALQRGGLLGPTTSGLLKGVIKILETSEAWVPGQSQDKPPPH